MKDRKKEIEKVKKEFLDLSHESQRLAMAITAAAIKEAEYQKTATEGEIMEVNELLAWMENNAKEKEADNA